MKVSISLCEDELRLLDELVECHKLSTRSAGVRRALKALRSEQLAAEYEACFSDPQFGEGSDLWDATVADGLD